MFLHWNKALSTGLEWQDDQHKQLFEHIKLLLEAMENHKASHEIGNLLTFLEQYVVFHFSAEQEQMVITNFPDMSAHLAKHEEFATIVRSMTTMFDKSGPSPYIVMKAQSAMRDWLLKHIATEDKILAAHILDYEKKNS